MYSTQPVCVIFKKKKWLWVFDFWGAILQQHARLRGRHCFFLIGNFQTYDPIATFINLTMAQFCWDTTRPDPGLSPFFFILYGILNGRNSEIRIHYLGAKNLSSAIRSKIPVDQQVLESSVKLAPTLTWRARFAPLCWRHPALNDAAATISLPFQSGIASAGEYRTGPRRPVGSGVKSS